MGTQVMGHIEMQGQRVLSDEQRAIKQAGKARQTVQRRQNQAGRHGCYQQLEGKGRAGQVQGGCSGAAWCQAGMPLWPAHHALASGDAMRAALRRATLAWRRSLASFWNLLRAPMISIMRGKNL